MIKPAKSMIQPKNNVHITANKTKKLERNIQCNNRARCSLGLIKLSDKAFVPALVLKQEKNPFRCDLCVASSLYCGGRFS
mmetsp:Transcript_3187/g.3619  ORF Transcript_3187/g.3619 Transcript_3187/m.3619 type:complete len:80 (-) Transcript_3187:619-858(-)